MQEIYKDIVGYEGLYQVSNLGNVKSFKKDKNGILLKPRYNRLGYPRVYLSNFNQQKEYKIHRLVALTFISNLENKPCVNHINGVKNDNKVDNLEWCTYSENNFHAHRTGLNIPNPRYGENHYNSKLKANDIIKIREDKRTQEKIAKDYGVDRSTIGYIKTNKLWAHIK